MKVNDIRNEFINYFTQRKHPHLQGSSLIPQNDPTLLFINAGMNQFKNIFLGLEKKEPPRAATVQKCVRAGGKHNDLEKVGYTARHHTFFEMLGNFSFGDYFKKEAIHYAWDFLTNTLSLPKDKLWITVFESDDEAFDIWHQQEGVPKNRIHRFKEKDNFWRMGDSGPCGPCSEIYYDLGKEHFKGPEHTLGGEGDRYMELWNLVFMQFAEDLDGNQSPLPNPSIDTGAGLERLASVLQGKVNNYDIDLFQNIISSASSFTQTHFDPKAPPNSNQHKINIALKVLADHSRAAAFLIADGVLPSNEGRGYVLRRILRRAIRYGRQLIEQDGVLPHVVHSVIKTMGSTYNELNEKKNLMISIVHDEEKRFLKTLDQGIHRLQQALNRLPQSGTPTLKGEEAFKLYDTYGFPLDLTRLIAKEQGVNVDEAGFQTHMEKAKKQAKASWKTKSLPQDAAHIIQVSQEISQQGGPTQFVGYTQTSHTGTLLLLSNGTQKIDAMKAGDKGLAIFDSSCFYAESGGQVGDKGQIFFPGGKAEIIDCTQNMGVFFHHIEVVEGTLTLGALAGQHVETSKRRDTAKNHSATHLMHSALRSVLGEHVTQAGSLVDENHLRFDFTHRSPLSIEETKQIEFLVNQEISKSIEVKTETMTPSEAKSTGALALFGEKYGDKVRVVQMGDFSMELCGGTHVSNTALIGLFKIVNEGSVSVGARRIEAITGTQAVNYLFKHTEESIEARQLFGIHEKWNSFLEENKENALIHWAKKSQKEVKNLEKEIKNLRYQAIREKIEQIFNESQAFTCQGIEGQLVMADLDIDDRQILRDVSDQIRQRLTSGVAVVLGTTSPLTEKRPTPSPSDKTLPQEDHLNKKAPSKQNSPSHPIVINVSSNLSQFIHAGNLLKEIASHLGGKGGGRPDSAQGALANRNQVATLIREKLIKLS